MRRLSPHLRMLLMVPGSGELLLKQIAMLKALEHWLEQLPYARML